jgi:hypothetical protein
MSYDEFNETLDTSDKKFVKESVVTCLVIFPGGVGLGITKINTRT